MHNNISLPVPQDRQEQTLLLNYNTDKKTRELYLLSVPRFEGLRIAHLAETDNARAHADTKNTLPLLKKHRIPSLINDRYFYLYIPKGDANNHIPGIYRCLVFSKIEVCEVPNRQDKTFSKRLINMS